MNYFCCVCVCVSDRIVFGKDKSQFDIQWPFINETWNRKQRRATTYENKIDAECMRIANKTKIVLISLKVD